MTSKKRIFIPVLLILGAIIVAIVLGSLRNAPERGGPERLPVLVEYQDVEVDDYRVVIDSQGFVQPKYNASLVAQVSGEVVYVSERFEAGGFFEAGEVLVRIDPSDYETAREEAQASVAQAQAAVAEERARGRVAEAEWRSIEAGEIPALGLREPQLASALASLQSAQARLAQAERNVERTHIRAPFAGVLQEKQISLGQYVSANTPVGRLFSTDLAEVRLPLTDIDLGFLDIPTGRLPDEAGPPVYLTATVSGESQRWAGSLVRTEGVVDATSQVTHGVVQVPDPYNRNGPTHEDELMFGRFVEAEVGGITLTGVVELPRHAVSSTGHVWVIDGEPGERVLERRAVTVERREQQTVLIGAGLVAGEKILLTQLDNPFPGQSVRIPGDEPAQKGDQ